VTGFKLRRLSLPQRERERKRERERERERNLRRKEEQKGNEANKGKANIGRTSSLIIRLGLRPSSSGGMRDPLRLLAPLPGAKEPLRLPTGVMSLLTSILGASAGALISGSFGCIKAEDGL
jgi:hypothetical protein